jgi:hypothetical protein
MKREMFVRVATATLKQYAGASPEVQAESLAQAMDLVRVAMGEAPAAAPPPQVPLPRPAFPAPNPEALAPAGFEVPASESPYEPEPEPEPEEVAPPEDPPLIVPATRIPDRVERVAPQPANPPARAPKQRLKVEQLSALIQKQTPERVPVEVTMEDGTTRRAVFTRDVISMHAFDSVQVVLYPAGALPSVREAAEVQAVVHLDDLPVDFQALMRNLIEQAAQAIRPRRPIQSVMPPATPGPVKNPKDTYEDPILSVATQNIFNSLG